jgi:hypothetical protein
MPDMLHTSVRARCACASVEFEAVGAPIASIACYCDDCRQAAREIEALPNAQPVGDRDTGTAYVLYRKDRVKCTKGNQLLKGYKIRGKSATTRLVATCCNSAMLVKFDDWKPWVSLYRSRMIGEAAPLQMRIFTRFKPENAELPNDVPNFLTYPAAFVARIVAAQVAMLLHR